MLTIKDLQTELQTLTNTKITQVAFANALGTSKGNISMRMKNGSLVTIEEIKKIITFLNIQGASELINTILKKQNRLITEYISEDSMPADDFVELDYYPSVFGSCGNGTFVLSEQKEKIKVPCQCLRNYSGFKNYSVINAKGDSMSPYILDKDRLIVEHYNGEQISDNKIYVFRYGENLFVKRLVLNIDQIVVKSDNKEYQSRNIEKQDMSEFQIIGKIVGIFREEC